MIFELYKEASNLVTFSFVAENIKSVTTKERFPIRVKQLDVTDDASVKTAMQAIFSETGRIDVLVDNAGYALYGAFEETSMEEIKSQFEVQLPLNFNGRNSLICRTYKRSNYYNRHTVEPPGKYTGGDWYSRKNLEM